jgi:hypothetical protein
MSLDLAQRLAAISVRNTRDEPVVLGSLWRDRAAVIVFVRHFG